VAAEAALGLREVVRVKRGRIELLGEHVRRLIASARSLGMAPPPQDPELRERVRAAVAKSATRDGLFELRWMSGALEIELVDGDPFGPDALAEGLALATASFARDAAAPTSAHKTTDRQDFLRARDEARRAGADEALLLNGAGRVAGAAAANLFVLRDDGLATPPVAEGALPGVMRAALLAAARSLGVPAREAPLSRADLLSAPDLLLTASAHGLLSVRSLDGAPLEKPRRGSLRKGLVPRLRLRLHELCDREELPAGE
jgi:branched-chain amino acid aminotransferase